MAKRYCRDRQSHSGKMIASVANFSLFRTCAQLINVNFITKIPILSARIEVIFLSIFNVLDEEPQRNQMK